MAYKLKLFIKYSGGIANENILSLHELSQSLNGLSRALSITNNILIENGRITKRNSWKKRDTPVRYYVSPSKTGSFIEIISIVFEEPAVRMIGSSVIGAVFWDMLKFTWKSAVGINSSVETPYSKNIIDRNPELPEEVSKVLESPLADLHRPIQSNHDMKIEVVRPRVGTLLKYDKGTFDYVNATSASISTPGIVGNITKYNNLTGYGRFYSDELGRTVPFNLAKGLGYQDIKLLSQSLHESNQDVLAGKVRIVAKITKTNNGNIKRYKIEGVEGL